MTILSIVDNKVGMVGMVGMIDMVIVINRLKTMQHFVKSSNPILM